MDKKNKIELHLTFGESRSPNLKKVVRMAKKIATFSEIKVGGVLKYLVIFNQTNFLKLIPIYQIIREWKSTELKVNGRLVGYNIYNIQRILDCYKIKGELGNSYCFGRINTGDRYLFGCRLLVFEHGIDWYSFGDLKGSVYYISKDRLKGYILSVVSEFFIDSCPGFSFDRIDKVINNLPCYIDTENNPNYEIVAGWYEGSFKPVGIKRKYTAPSISVSFNNNGPGNKNFFIPTNHSNPALLPTIYNPEFANKQFCKKNKSNLIKNFVKKE